eukprot:CAMPEP_0196234756 /NCGR_PEP_ID=MMETSP0913-20130531/4765_1 /TAXON_ID=49265 /ORGANISM="Thalassiosira rotula, Strain GSO102" /LENGTH=41 /DNA_ID= /DNA_START= /DNA_END= /DNA_ORIENTATION=
MSNFLQNVDLGLVHNLLLDARREILDLVFLRVDLLEEEGCG